MKRLVYAFDSADSAHAEVSRLREHGLDEQQLSLVARPDIAKREVSAEMADASMDVVPATLRGALYGGAIGLLAAIVAGLVPALGLETSLFSFALFIVLGAFIGMWLAGMVGSAIPSKVQRLYDREIEAGRVLLVIDARGRQVRRIKQWMQVDDPHLVWQGEVSQPAK